MLKQSFFQKDISRRVFWLGVLCLTAARLVLASQQQIYTWLDGAPLDDELVFAWAQSISAGQWLGEYNYLTLSKRPFFAVWLALLNKLGLPYLISGQALWCAAALAGALAFAPVIKTYKSRLALFAFLCWNPAGMAAFTWRVYRDNIYPALCLLFFAGLVGWALRCTGSLAKSTGWLALAGLGLACGWLCREDGVWVLPFALAGVLAGVVTVLRAKGLKKKLARCLLAALPFVMLAGGVGAVTALNRAHYGVAVVSDFSEGSFADAMGAMTRVAETEEVPLVSIPTEVRLMLYRNVPQLAPFEYWLEEDEDLQNSFRNPALDDYQSGSFYWALRRAAQYQGIYDTAAGAENFWAEVAREINNLCENGTLPSEGGRRSGTTPPVRMGDVHAVLAECFRSLGYVLTFADCLPYETSRTIGPAEDLAVWESYLKTTANDAAVAGSDAPYYNLLQKAVFALLNALRWGYALALPVVFAAGVFLWLREGLRLWKNRREVFSSACCPAVCPLLLWVCLFGLVAMAALRVGMISFMEVVSFNIGTYVMYLATVHPLLLLFGGVCCLVYHKK